MSYRRWTDKETEYLMKNYGRITVPTIAKKLNRTIKAVEIKTIKLKLGYSYEAQGSITASELARVLGRAKSVIYRWIYENNLKSTLKITGKKQKYQMISPKDFWNFAKDNPSFMKWELYERGSLLPEPKWLYAEISNYFRIRNKNKDKKWTKAEECYLLAYYNKGKQIKEISKNMGRSQDAIWFRLKKLNVKKRVIHLKWGTVEDEMLISMRGKGMYYKDIAEEMGRSKRSVQRRYERLCKEVQV